VRGLTGIKRSANREEGVTLVIVTLCLVALFGMLVLVVDVGGLLLNRREMVNASDAAALAAAKSCILPATKDPLLPEEAADKYAADNSSKAKVALPGNVLQISGPSTPPISIFSSHPCWGRGTPAESPRRQRRCGARRKP
jgi:uncharacterized membrane protein